MATKAQRREYGRALAAVRARIVELSDPAKRVRRFCPRCLSWFPALADDKRQYCPECNGLAYFEAGESMSRKSGPTYEKAVRGQLAYWTKEAKRLGL